VKFGEFWLSNYSARGFEDILSHCRWAVSEYNTDLHVVSHRERRQDGQYEFIYIHTWNVIHIHLFLSDYSCSLKHLVPFSFEHLHTAPLSWLSSQQLIAQNSNHKSPQISNKEENLNSKILVQKCHGTENSSRNDTHRTTYFASCALELRRAWRTRACTTSCRSRLLND
jgi:hypothetical protein